jgi:hypothetical protein
MIRFGSWGRLKLCHNDGMTDPLLTPEGRKARLEYWMHTWPETLTLEEAQQTVDSEVIDAYIEAIGDVCHATDAGGYGAIIRMLQDVHATFQARLS